MGRFASIADDDRVALIFVDYPNQMRLKLLARASVVTAASAPDAFAALTAAAAEDGARIERAFVLRVEGFDWNCPQHITPRFGKRGARRPRAAPREARGCRSQKPPVSATGGLRRATRTTATVLE